MYYQANDNELIYLIREGNATAYRVLYKKYEHLIFKIYKEHLQNRGIVLQDFMQEGFMCLEKSIHTYQEGYNCSFYSYYCIMLRRYCSKLFRKRSLNLRESSKAYNKEAPCIPMSSRSYMIKIIARELNLADDLEKDIFYEGILHSVQIAEIARKYGVDYQSVYKKYKKIKQKIEKILTNA